MVKTLNCGTVKPGASGCAVSKPGCYFFPPSPAQIAGSRCLNLVENPGFETGLTGWSTNNVSISNGNPFEGTQEAVLGSNVASIFQDIPMDTCCSPLFLSFNVFAASNNHNNGSLVAEVLWLNKDRNTMATGLRLFIPENRINSSTRITYFAITDRPPSGTAYARLQFSKGAGSLPDPISLDQVILARVSSLNLVQNPGFELGLTHWASISFAPNFSVPYEGAAQVHATDYGALFQEIPINNLPVHTPFLLSFAAAGSLTSLRVLVLWLNHAGNPIGAGINLFIPGDTFVAQANNYLTYLDLTQPAPAGAVTASILFTDIIGKQVDIFIDQVILVGAKTTNLIQNPSFENGLNQWTSVNTAAVFSGQAYEGSVVARVDVTGGALFQDVLLPSAAGHCFLFNFGLRSTSIGVDLSGNTLAGVYWLDSAGREIGPGLNLVVPNTSLRAQWLVYTGITEPAPPGVAAARVKFTRSTGSPAVFLDIDKVVLGRLT